MEMGAGNRVEALGADRLLMACPGGELGCYARAVTGANNCVTKTVQPSRDPSTRPRRYSHVSLGNTVHL